MNAQVLDRSAIAGEPLRVDYTAEYALLERGDVLKFDSFPNKFSVSVYQRYPGRGHCRKKMGLDRNSFYWVVYIDPERN